MICGVASLIFRGVPAILNKDELKKKGLLEAFRNKVKSAIVIGDEICKDIEFISIYDAEPVYFLSNACEETKWVEKHR